MSSRCSFPDNFCSRFNSQDLSKLYEPGINKELAVMTEICLQNHSILPYYPHYGSGDTHGSRITYDCCQCLHLMQGHQSMHEWQGTCISAISQLSILLMLDQGILPAVRTKPLTLDHRHFNINIMMFACCAKPSYACENLNRNPTTRTCA